jgi:hypothetical protein
MPEAPAKTCRDCPSRAIFGSPYCTDHQEVNEAVESRRARDKSRWENNPFRRLYLTARWEATRRRILYRDPLCKEFIFQNWRPLYLIKSTRSYAFSENAEYRDILLVARKERARSDDRVKVCFLKKNLATMSEQEIADTTEQIAARNRRRSEVMDIDTHRISDFTAHSHNMLWFLGTENLSHRDVLVDFCARLNGSTTNFPENYFREGYRPVPKGISKLLFLTRAFNAGRIEESFLRFVGESKSGNKVKVSTALGTEWDMDLQDFTPSLRTSVGVSQMDITNIHDYIAHQPYDQLSRVKRAAAFAGEVKANQWERIQDELEAVKTNVVVARRLDYGSPNFHLISWVSERPLSPSNQVSVIREPDQRRAEAVCVVLNSALFLAYFFLLKEQSHARYADIRFYDLHEMPLYPIDEMVPALCRIYRKFGQAVFPSLREQLDQNFAVRYREYWEGQNATGKQAFLFSVLDKPVDPQKERVKFDLAVCEALGIEVDESDLNAVHEVLVKEIIITRRLTKD